MSYIENLAAESDYRTTAIDDRWWGWTDGRTATIKDAELYDDMPESIPVFMVVCPACDGRGRYVNPSIDAHGISADEFHEDPDFAAAYMSGDYDVGCVLCEGDRVVPVPTNKDDRAEIEELLREAHEIRAEILAEMRFGA